MRILKLDLRAFGPFTDVVVDLSGGNEGLHVIYGPNEAGKSSALRALEQMLFGIPLRSADDFLHPKQNLRIGATLGRAGLSPLAFLRRKGTKGTLLAADNGALPDEAALRPFLEGLDRDVFTTMFGIGHAQLVEGGQEIVHGQGDVGQLLFAAGSGIADLRAVRDRLESEAGALFKTRGQTQRINQRLRDLDAAKGKIRQSQLHSDDWANAQKALQEAHARLKDVEERLQQVQREKHRLERIQQALPISAKRSECRSRLEAMGEVTILPSGFAERRREAATGLILAQQARETAQQELDRIDQQLQPLVIPEALLAQAPQIERLPDLLGSHRKAQQDLPRLCAQKEQLEREAAAILRQLRPDLALEAAEQVRLTRAQQLEIQNLGGKDAALSQQLRRAQSEIEASQTALTQAQSELASLEKPRDPAPLKAALRRVQSQGDLEEQLDRAAATLRQAEEQAAVDLTRLMLWSGTIEEMERLPLPSTETVDRCENELARAERQVRSLEEKSAEGEAGRADFDRQIEQLRLEGEVPTEGELLSARRLRDGGWELVLAAWKGGGPDAQRLAEFLRRFPAPPDLAAAYPQAVTRADDLSDRLRREANRVAARANLQAHREALARQLAALKEQADQACGQYQRLGQAWADCWRPAGIKPLGPREMRAWLARQRNLVEQARAIRAQRAGLRQLQDRIQAGRRPLEQCLVELGEPPPRDDETLAALLDRCAATVEHVEAAAAKRQQLDKDARQLHSRLAAAHAAAQKAEAERSQWREGWAAALEPLGLPPETTPAVANDFVARIGDLFERLKEAQGLEERIAGIGSDAQAFRQQVEHLCRQVAADLAALPAEQAADELIARLRQAWNDQRSRETLQAQRRRYAAERDKAAQAVAHLTACLATMCQEAGCSAPESLPEAEGASETASRLQESLASLDDQLLALSSGAGIEALLAEAGSVEPDELPARLRQLDEQIQQGETEKQGLSETIGATRSDLAHMDDSAVAADAAEEVQDLMAQIASDAEHYARLRLTLAVLREGIERYRKKNEGPVLRRASQWFQQLTLGSFEGLRADVDEQGKNVLVGVRPGGAETVGLSGMSDGTGDQLYLALRLASLENYLANQEPIPFIMDDILISFDDARAMAALGLLAEFSRRTQILFFTHHQHLVELARASLPDGVLFVHQLHKDG